MEVWVFSKDSINKLVFNLFSSHLPHFRDLSNRTRFELVRLLVFLELLFLFNFVQLIVVGFILSLLYLSHEERLQVFICSIHSWLHLLDSSFWSVQNFLVGFLSTIYSFPLCLDVLNILSLVIFCKDLPQTFKFFFDGVSSFFNQRFTLLIWHWLLGLVSFRHLIGWPKSLVVSLFSFVPLFVFVDNEIRAEWLAWCCVLFLKDVLEDCNWVEIWNVSLRWLRHVLLCSFITLTEKALSCTFSQVSSGSYRRKTSCLWKSSRRKWHCRHCLALRKEVLALLLGGLWIVYGVETTEERSWLLKVRLEVSSWKGINRNIPAHEWSWFVVLCPLRWIRTA